MKRILTELRSEYENIYVAIEINTEQFRERMKIVQEMEKHGVAYLAYHDDADIYESVASMIADGDVDRSCEFCHMVVRPNSVVWVVGIKHGITTETTELFRAHCLDEIDKHEGDWMSEVVSDVVESDRLNAEEVA